MSKLILPLSIVPTAVAPDKLRPEAGRSQGAPAPLRSISRPDTLTAQRVEVGLVLHAMLGIDAATEYLSKHDVDINVMVRVLSPGGPRRGSHDEYGVRAIKP